VHDATKAAMAKMVIVFIMSLLPSERTSTLSVTAGQKMSVQLNSSNASLYFNVTAPGADAAMYNSSIEGNGTSITIPSSGKYAIDVYLMRNAARRNESASYDLTLYVE
jgi:hypothetical protein